MTGIVSLLFKAILGSFVDAFNAWRRDKSLEDLGYTRAQRDVATEALRNRAKIEKARDIQRQRIASGVPDPDARRWDE